MGDKSQPLNVLFLRTGDSARSIMAEAIVNRPGAGQFRFCAAGSTPKGETPPSALETLRRNNLFVNLPLESLDRLAAPRRLDAIGQPARSAPRPT